LRQWRIPGVRHGCDAYRKAPQYIPGAFFPAVFPLCALRVNNFTVYLLRDKIAFFFSGLSDREERT
jgi:hypothetical protein